MNVQTEIQKDFSNEIQNVINGMCMINNDGLIIAGSSGLKNMMYPNDIDLHQIVDVSYKTKKIAVKELVNYFQKMITRLKEQPNVFITDIKFGSIPDYDILDRDVRLRNNKVVNYNYNECVTKLTMLHDRNTITNDEFKDAKKVLTKNSPTLKQYFVMKDAIKFSTVRLTVNDVINGHINFRNTTYKLSDLLLSGLVKVDVVAYINGKYTEFSNIYEFKNSNKMISPIMTNLDDSLKEDIMYNYVTKNYYKMAKRIFVMNVFEEKESITTKLMILFNSQLGIIYNVLSDIKVLILLLSRTGRLSYKKLSYEINMFKVRLSRVYSVNSFLSEQDSITEIIDKLSKVPHSADRREIFFHELSSLLKKLETILNENTKKELKQMHLLPLPKKYQL
jgi:hypothetical protein